MKLCFSTLVCPTWSFPEIVGAAAAHGLHGIDPRGIGSEIDVTKLSTFNDELDATLELLRAHELTIPCFQTSVALVTPAQERWQMMLDECQRYARLAGRVGASYVRVFGGAAPKGMTRGEALSMAHRHARQLVKICAPHGCQVVMETHDDWTTVEEAMPLLELFEPEELGALWDVEHPYRKGETPEQTVRGLSRYVRHVHFKDSLREEGNSIPRLIGDGDLPVRGFLSALQSIRYDRWICLETEKRWHPEVAPEPEESLPRFAQFMSENWGPVARRA